MLNAMIASLILTWLSFWCAAMSLITMNFTGLFWYSMAMTVFGVVTKILLKYIL